MQPHYSKKTSSPRLSSPAPVIWDTPQLSPYPHLYCWPHVHFSSLGSLGPATQTLSLPGSLGHGPLSHFSPKYQLKCYFLSIASLGHPTASQFLLTLILFRTRVVGLLALYVDCLLSVSSCWEGSNARPQICLD